MGCCGERNPFGVFSGHSDKYPEPPDIGRFERNLRGLIMRRKILRKVPPSKVLQIKK